MTPNYTYISSKDFINNLIFDYVETYSFQRGLEYELQQESFENEYDELQTQRTKSNDLTTQQVDRLLFLEKLCGFTQYLLDNSNKFHYSSKKTNTFSSSDSKTELLKNILRTEIKEIPSWMCAPMYRDAIVFYDKSKQIVSTLNVCLSCEYMETKMFSHINGDNKTYDLLRQFFTDLGHQIEDR